ncbi:MAG: hypothetical protein COW85_03220 [Ignavibacteria bacterium CG22_combo_CG10-13_8_21_14_all_37_15]|nr:MAG: hypothetical protein COW85_03220 [Ignavibacteria bacterium CG22_combo_CG10-13_8_21_14_all_37_15]PIS44069.1 MAG: hypothetical protein COT22_12500 [Ignavibacteria bacterium CG08_land_8_20_14_0_20_37_9]PIX93219.1 MAG: hypothetical protein COZ25_11800 [Ignavibacteria bacterium CG_4_10_14_3_um_filter_37_18]PJC57951.1 MAG: hypothetical protein CO025_10665 [Ignavibacteria bacterium CG_4_9_14_0_2_um_filter_37_13]
MKRTYSFITTIIFFAFIFSGVGVSQGLQETLTKLTGTAGEAYVSPIISAFGSNLNSGWVHKSPSSKIFGVDIEVGIVAMATMFGDNNKTFSTNGTFRFSQAQAREMIDASTSDPKLLFLTSGQKDELANLVAQKEFTVGISGPTIVGKKESEVMVDFSGAEIAYNSQTYKVDPKSVGTKAMGFLGDASALPLVAPQFSIGTVYGTMATFRFLPSVEVGDLGKFSYFGFGLQHNPAMFIPVPLPVDVSVAFFTQSLQVGEIFKASATTFGLYASKTFGWGISITPFAGFAMESSSVDVSYDVDLATSVPGVTVPSKVAFKMDGENSARLTIGASIKLALINLSVDYSLAKYNSASFGLNFIF